MNLDFSLFWRVDFYYDGTYHRTLTNQMKRDIQIELSKYLINYKNVAGFVYINSIFFKCGSSFLRTGISGQKSLTVIELEYTCYDGDVCTKTQLVELEVEFS